MYLFSIIRYNIPHPLSVRTGYRLQSRDVTIEKDAQSEERFADGSMGQTQL